LAWWLCILPPLGLWLVYRFDFPLWLALVGLLLVLAWDYSWFLAAEEERKRGDEVSLARRMVASVLILAVWLPLFLSMGRVSIEMNLLLGAIAMICQVAIFWYVIDRPAASERKG
jgi:phosphatidylglycerophosphate synthase